MDYSVLTPEIFEEYRRKVGLAEKYMKLAYRKHALGDESIGWDELTDHLCNGLCEIMGDTEFQNWLEQPK